MGRFLRPGVLVVCTALAVGLAACGDDDDSGSTTAAATSAAAEATSEAAEATSAAAEETTAAAEETTAAAEETTAAAEETTAAAEESSAAAGEAVALPGDCGKLPFAAPKEDPNKILDGLALPENLQAAYNNYGPPLFDTYKDFKPKNGPPWKVAYSDSFSGNAWRAAALASLQENFAAAKEQNLVEGDLIVTDSNGKNDVQIQQMRQMIQQGVDIIFSIPASPTAMNGVIEEAYNAGIPVLTLSAPVTSEYAINVDTNQLVYGARQAQGLVMLLEGKGDILAVEGIAGTPGSQGIEEGGKAILGSCPDINIVADFSGDWNNATAKTETLKALATNPGNIDGVWEQGSMEKGIIEAFEQAGRDVPPVTMGNPDQAGLAYWRDHQADGYHTAATAQPSAAGADAMFRVGMRILEGKGPKITSIVGNPPLTVDSDNLAAAQATFPDADVQVLDDWVKPEWTFDSTGVANPASGPTGTWLNDEMLDSFFTEAGTNYQGIENAGQG